MTEEPFETTQSSIINLLNDYVFEFWTQMLQLVQQLLGGGGGSNSWHVTKYLKKQ